MTAAMRALQHFERRLEGAVEGFFARAFRSGLQPIELAKAVQRYAEDHQHVTSDGVVVPNVYRVEVAPKDHERLAGFGESLPRELGEVVVMTASERGWQLRGPVKVRIDVAAAVKVGRYRLAGRVEVVENPDVAGPVAPPPSSPPASSAAVFSASSPPSGARGAATGMAARRDVLSLRVMTGATAGDTIPVSGQRMTMGRLSTCAVTVSDSTVSREHAALVRRGDRWWVIDLGSTNGTRVNGVRAAEQPVSPGDRIQLGDAIVEFVGG